MADFATTTDSTDGLDVLAQTISEKIGIILESRLFPTILTEVEKKSKAALQTKETYTKKIENFSKDLEDKGLFGIGYDFLKKKLSKKENKEVEPLKQATEALKMPSVEPPKDKLPEAIKDTDEKQKTGLIDLIKQATETLKLPPAQKLQEKLPQTIKDNKDFKQNVSTANADIIEEVEEKPKTVILGGLTADFEKRLPDILKDIFKKEKVEEKEEKKDDYSEGGLLSGIPGWVKALGGGLALILGGITALVMAFKTDGGSKGTLELIGKLGIKGGLVLLAKKIFGMTLKTALKRIPIIGTLISYGFAFQRFSKGDTMGGIIDLVSGTVQLLDLVAPGLGTVLSLGVDIMQAVLDAKAGGSSAEASAKKGGILLDWAKGLGSLLWKGLKFIPVLGPLFDAVDSMRKGDWGDFTLNLLRSVGQMSGVVYVIDLIDTLTGGNLKSQAKEGLKTAGSWLKGLGEWLYEKVIDLPIIGPLIKSTEALFSGQWKDSLIWLGRAVPAVGMIMSWLDVKTSDESKEVKQEGPKKSPFAAIKDAILEKARAWWKSTWSWVKWLAKRILPKNVIESLQGQVDEKLEGIETPVGEVKVETDSLDNLKKSGAGITDKVKDWAKEQVSKFSETYKNVSQTVSDIGKWVHENVVLKVAGFIKDTVKKMFDWVKNIFGSVTEKLGSFFKPAVTDSNKQVKDQEQRLTAVEANLKALTEAKQKEDIKQQEPVLNEKQISAKEKFESVYRPKSLKEEEIKKWINSVKENMQTDVKPVEEQVRVQPEENQIRAAENIQQTNEKPISIDAKDTPVIDEKFLRDISDNTEKTHMSLENLIRLMYKFTQVLDKKMLPEGQQGPKIILGQQQEYETASRAAATNFDPIRQVRSQFTLDSV